MLLGARQVGKTYILDKFCSQNFKEYLYVNLERDLDIKNIFESINSIEEIVNAVSILKKS